MCFNFNRTMSIITGNNNNNELLQEIRDDFSRRARYKSGPSIRNRLLGVDHTHSQSQVVCDDDDDDARRLENRTNKIIFYTTKSK